MFDPKWAPLLPSLRARISGHGAWPSSSGLLPITLAVVLAVTSSFAAASPVSVYEPDAEAASGPSIQYEEAVSHAAEHYSLPAGGVVTVPFRPRPDDTTTVDGAAPVALPAGLGGPVTPSATDPGTATPDSATTLRREVFGFLPYWQLGTTLDYETISTIAYFGIDLNTDGTLDEAGNGWNGWMSDKLTTVINAAHSHGTRVVLTVESFAWDSSGATSQGMLLGSPTASLAAAKNIAAEVKRRGADGVNLDFEPIANYSVQSANFIAFVKTLRTEMDKAHPGYELTFCATAEPNTYDLEHLLVPGGADAVFIMGYDLRGGSPKNTGSIDPLYSPWVFDLTDSVTRFLAQVPASKVILGLPWYGHAWSTGGPITCTACQAVNAPQANLDTYGQPAAVPYYTAADLAGTVDSTHTGKLYDTVESTAWTAYFGNYGGTQDTWRQLYFDDARALGEKMDAIDRWGLRGTGIWALGYDNNNGDGDLTNQIAAKYESAYVPTTYYPLPPTRILDTRKAVSLAGPFSSHVARYFQVTGVTVPANATAVTGNLTVTGQTSPGYLYIGPTAMNNPTSSTLNFPAGDDRANEVTVALGIGGVLWVTYAAPTVGPTADVIFDVTGYFAPDTEGATYVPVTPNRILDTRYGTGLTGSFGSHVSRRFQVTGGTSGVPSTATAVTGNLTVTGQTSAGFLYIGPSPMSNPTSSSLNFPLGDDRANAVTVVLTSKGSLWVTYAAPTLGKTAQVVFDVTGYFAPGSGGARYVPLKPNRILDTRYGTGLKGSFNSHVARQFQATGGTSPVPANATAVTGNLTVTGQTAAGFLYLGPNSINDPTSSTLNFPRGDDRANGVDVALGSGGVLWATYAASTKNQHTQVIFDVTGYFAP
jgi:spore germination protein YaaH/serine protease inhibitor ecotin